jgi:hypothetical protein
VFEFRLTPNFTTKPDCCCRCYLSLPLLFVVAVAVVVVFYGMPQSTRAISEKRLSTARIFRRLLLTRDYVSLKLLPSFAEPCIGHYVYIRPNPDGVLCFGETIHQFRFIAPGVGFLGSHADIIALPLEVPQWKFDTTFRPATGLRFSYRRRRRGLRESVRKEQV